MQISLLEPLTILEYTLVENIIMLGLLYCEFKKERFGYLMVPIMYILQIWYCEPDGKYCLKVASMLNYYLHHLSIDILVYLHVLRLNKILII